jgi:hypothetical protein
LSQRCPECYQTILGLLDEVLTERKVYVNDTPALVWFRF